jgi:hypothetical protein
MLAILQVLVGRDSLLPLKRAEGKVRHRDNWVYMGAGCQRWAAHPHACCKPRSGGSSGGSSGGTIVTPDTKLLQKSPKPWHNSTSFDTCHKKLY